MATTAGVDARVIRVDRKEAAAKESTASIAKKRHSRKRK
jgi:hypothetical protein